MFYPPHILNLDLCILAYQLYHQSLVWPLDPWYEAIAHAGTDRRTGFMYLTRKHAAATLKTRQLTDSGKIIEPSEDHAHYSGVDSLRFGNSLYNPRLDPILTNYARINPQYPALTRDGEKFVAIQTPKLLTDKIGAIRVAKKGGIAPGVVNIVPVRTLRGASTLVAFEGGTGAVGSPASMAPYDEATYSLMGFVMALQNAAGRWDVHIVFRGSRSGDAGRAAAHAADKAVIKQAISRNAATVSTGKKVASGGALLVGAPLAVAVGILAAPVAAAAYGSLPDEQAGNADWITDMDNMTQVSCARISKIGKVGRGFTNSVISCLLPIQAALRELNLAAPPDSIIVTGHSLGAALATVFTSAVSMGTFADELSAGPLAAWPWARTQCVCYALPVVGDSHWAAYFNLVNEAQIKYIWVAGDVVVTGGRSGFAITGGISGHHGGMGIELDPLSPVVADNPHEIYVIRACLLRDTTPAEGVVVHDKLKVEEAIRRATPWAYYSTFQKLIAGTAFSYRPSVSEEPKILKLTELRTVLQQHRFAEEWARYIIIYSDVMTMPSSYRGATKASWLRARKTAILHTLAVLWDISSPEHIPSAVQPAKDKRHLTHRAKAPILKRVVLQTLEAELETLDSAIAGTTGMAKAEFQYLCLGFVLLVYTRRSDMRLAEFIENGTHTKTALSSALGATDK